MRAERKKRARTDISPKRRNTLAQVPVFRFSKSRAMKKLTLSSWPSRSFVTLTVRIAIFSSVLLALTGAPVRGRGGTLDPGGSARHRAFRSQKHRSNSLKLLSDPDRDDVR